MINPLSTKAQRKAVLDDLTVAVLEPDEKATARCLAALRPALDGLNIADERDMALVKWAADLWPHHKVEENHQSNFCMCCRFWKIARPWQDWKQDGMKE